MFRTTRKHMLPVVALTASISLLAAACSGGDDASETPKPGGNAAPTNGETAAKIDRPLVVFAGSQTPITANFNPYAPGVLHGAMGPIYENLFYYNKTAADAPVPMLGESFTYNEDGTELTVKIRQGVKWNDGKDLTAQDVVFSFTNVAAQAKYIKSVTSPDASTVVITGDEPLFANEFAMLGGTFVVPEHVFGEYTDIDKMVAFANDKDPVGTGPFMLEAATGESYTLKANPTYWQTGKPALQTVQYLGIDANNSAQNLITAGEIDYMSLFVPDPESITNGGIVEMVNTPMDPTVIYTCSDADQGCEGAQTDVAVRQAIDIAINRGEINDKAFVGLAGNISPTFALLGRDDKWIGDGMPKESPQAPDVAKAEKILTDAGYAKGSDGIFAKDGKRVSMKLFSISGWSDYNAAAELIATQAKAAGIEIVPEQGDWDGFSAMRLSGKFELIMGGMTGTSIADPFTLYRDWFTSERTQPVGKDLVTGSGQWNIPRYTNDIVDAAVATAAATNDEAVKKEAYAKLQAEITRDLPYIPIVINATQSWFNTADYGNWPTDNNMFAFPAAWGSGSAGVVLANVTAPTK